MGTISGGVFDGSSVVGWSGWSDSNHCARPTLTYLRSSWGIQLGCSSSVRAWSIWSLGVPRHGGRGHRLTLAGERFAGLASEYAAAFAIFFSYGAKEALLSVVTAVIPVLLPMREAVPELAYLHREERGHSKIQPIPYDLCTHSN